MNAAWALHAMCESAFIPTSSLASRIVLCDLFQFRFNLLNPNLFSNYMDVCLM